MRSVVRVICLALCLMSVSLSGCTGESTAADARSGPEQYPYQVVTTVGMVTDIVREVAGEHATVTGLIGEGVDPHLYKPTRNDVAALLEADVVFYSGLLLEGKMTDALVKVASGGKPVFAVTELIDESYLLDAEGTPGHADPHVWMDVEGWMKAVEAVAQSLSSYDPAHADEYRANAETYLKELTALDEYVQKVIGSIPEQQRVLITAHDAFSYFGRAYDIDVRGIQGISTESEAGVDAINRLVDLIVSNNIGAVFVETSVSSKSVQALVEGAAGRGRQVVIGGSLFSDAMGAPGTYEGTYIGMIDHNATTIAHALGGTAPERGMNGKLGE